MGVKMETERHFGRLLTSPFCTRKHPYVINVLKSLISICSAGKETYFISHIKFLRLEVSRYGYRDTSVCFQEISALIHILSRRFQDDLYFYESFMLLVVLVLPAGSDEKEWGMILSDGLKRIWAGPQAISVLSALDEIYSDFGKDLFKALAPLVTLDLVSPIMLESFTKAVTSRFDDDFNGAWQLVSSIDRNIMPRLNPQRNLDIFLSFAKAQRVLGKISPSEAALDLAVNLLERLFGCRLEFRDDDDGALMIELSELIHLNLARQDLSCQNWIISSLTSNIRRLIPSTPIDVGASGIDCQFINMTRFTSLLLSKFPSDPLYQISVQFIGSFASPKGLSKNSVLCSAYISTMLQPGFLLRCEPLAQDILLDVLEHCEGTSQVLDESYLGCLHVALQQIREQLRIETSRPLLSLLFIGNTKFQLPEHPIISG